MIYKRIEELAEKTEQAIKDTAVCKIYSISPSAVSVLAYATAKTLFEQPYISKMTISEIDKHIDKLKQELAIAYATRKRKEEPVCVKEDPQLMLKL
jgi:hypothetical protein